VHRHPFWSEWVWGRLLRGELTLAECIERLRLEQLYRRTGTL
jgi:hypothetical protein